MLWILQGMDIEGAEKWIVDLIRGSQLDAKIDSRDNNVIMGGTFPSVYQQVRAIPFHRRSECTSQRDSPNKRLQDFDDIQSWHCCWRESKLVEIFAEPAKEPYI